MGEYWDDKLYRITLNNMLRLQRIVGAGVNRVSAALRVAGSIPAINICLVYQVSYSWSS